MRYIIYRALVIIFSMFTVVVGVIYITLALRYWVPILLPILAMLPAIIASAFIDDPILIVICLVVCFVLWCVVTYKSPDSSGDGVRRGREVTSAKKALAKSAAKRRNRQRRNQTRPTSSKRAVSGRKR